MKREVAKKSDNLDSGIGEFFYVVQKMGAIRPLLSFFTD